MIGVRSRYLGLMVAILLCAGVSQAGFDPLLRYNFAFNGGGARAAGMGNAFIAVSNDLTAGSWNPAGLLQVDRVALNLTYRNLYPAGSSVPLPYAENTPFAVTPSVASFSHDGTVNSISALSIVVPTRVKGSPVAFGLGYARNFDEFQSESYSFFDTVSFTIPIGGSPVQFNSPTDFSYDSDLRGGLNSVNISLAAKLNPKLSAGASVNVYFGKTYRTATLRQYSRDFPLGFFAQEGDLDLPFTRLDSNKFNGFNFTLGLMYRLPKLTLGLVARTPFNLDVSLDSVLYIIPLLNGQRMADFTDTILSPRQLTRYEMPLILRGGAAYQMRENWLLSFDLEFQAFSGQSILRRTELRINPGGQDEETFETVDPEWNTVFAVRAGTEYLWKTKAGTVPLRAGAGFIPLSQPSYGFDVNALLDTTLTLSSESVNSISFSLGTGIHWSQVLFDIAYTYTSYDRSAYSYFTAPNPFATIAQGLVPEVTVWASPLDQKYRAHQISVGFTGYF